MPEYSAMFLQSTNEILQTLIQTAQVFLPKEPTGRFED